MADYTEFKRKMEKTVEVLVSDFDSVRAGRANAKVLDRITVPYYGAESPIAQVASVSSPDPRTLTIQPWDSSLLKPLEKAIQARGLEVPPFYGLALDDESVDLPKIISDFRDFIQSVCQ